MDFSSILEYYGFTRDTYDFESSVIGFDYDVHTVLLGSMTPFDINRSRIYRQFECPSALIRAEIVIKRYCIDRAIKFFLQRWRTELRYLNPICEIIEIYESSDSASIHVLSITETNAITLLINFSHGVFHEPI